MLVRIRRRTRWVVDASQQAKVILVQREVESWYRSFESNVIGNLFSRSADIIVDFIEPLLGSRLGKFNRRLLLGYFGASTSSEMRKRARTVYAKAL